MAPLFLHGDDSIETLMNEELWTLDDSADFSRSFHETKNDDDDLPFLWQEEEEDPDSSDLLELEEPTNEEEDSETNQGSYFYDWFHEFEKEYDV